MIHSRSDTDEDATSVANDRLQLINIYATFPASLHVHYVNCLFHICVPKNNIQIMIDVFQDMLVYVLLAILFHAIKPWLFEFGKRCLCMGYH